MKPSLFVTGTDTGVGKTVVTAGLVALDRAAGSDTVPMKAVQTGSVMEGTCLMAPDLAFCLAASGMDPALASSEDYVPYRYLPPCSPHLAASQAGEQIAIERIVSRARALQARHERVICEGAGGLLVPLNEKETMADLMVAIGWPVVLVARPGLGTLNHTLLSLETLRTRDLTVAAVVLVESEPSARGFIEQDNVDTIRRMGQVEVLGPIPFDASLATATPEPARLRELVDPILHPLI